MADPQKKITQGELPAAGRYDAKVIEHDLGEANTGNVQVAVGFAFTDAGGKGWRASWYGSFTERAIANPKALSDPLRVLGFDLDVELKKPEPDLAPLGRKTDENKTGGALVGREASIVIAHEKVEAKGQDGKYHPVLCDDTKKPLMRAEVQWINAPGGGSGQMFKAPATSAAAITGLAAKVKAAAFGQTAPRSSTGAAPSTAAAGPKPGANPLPF